MVTVVMLLIPFIDALNQRFPTFSEFDPKLATVGDPLPYLGKLINNFK